MPRRQLQSAAAGPFGLLGGTTTPPTSNAVTDNRGNSSCTPALPTKPTRSQSCTHNQLCTQQIRSNPCNTSSRPCIRPQARAFRVIWGVTMQHSLPCCHNASTTIGNSIVQQRPAHAATASARHTHSDQTKRDMPGQSTLLFHKRGTCSILEACRGKASSSVWQSYWCMDRCTACVTCVLPCVCQLHAASKQSENRFRHVKNCANLPCGTMLSTVNVPSSCSADASCIDCCKQRRWCCWNILVQRPS